MCIRDSKESSTISSGVKGCGMDNDIVFGMAVHYYDEDDIKVNKQTNYKVSAVSVKKEVATEHPETKKPASSPNKRKGKKTEIQMCIRDRLQRHLHCLILSSQQFSRQDSECYIEYFQIHS